jgi:hypothetical protein
VVREVLEDAPHLDVLAEHVLEALHVSAELATTLLLITQISHSLADYTHAEAQKHGYLRRRA